jgi:hypothetical protein
VLAPGLVTVVWLVIVAVVTLVAAVVVRRCPLARDTRSLLELGVAVMALLLVSPLTEYIYTVLLVIPLLGIYGFVRQRGLRSPAVWRIAACLVIAWLVLCMPIQHIEFYFGGLMGRHPALDPVYDLLAPTFLYVMIGILALQLYTVRQVSGRPLGEAIRSFIAEAPGQSHQLVAAALTALTSLRTRRPSPQQP